MKLELRGGRRVWTAGLQRHAQRRVSLLLGRFGRSITRVTVRSTDLNGEERGGVDKLCLIAVRVPPRATVVAEGRHSDMKGAIDQAAERTARAVSRLLEVRRWSREGGAIEAA